MAAAPLGFKVPGKACVLPGGARAAALPPMAGRPALAPQPLSTPASVARPASAPLRAPAVAKAACSTGLRKLKVKARGGEEVIIQRCLRSRAPQPTHVRTPTTPTLGPGTQ